MLHPIRVAAVLVVGLPIALLLIAGLTAATGHCESARTFYRWTRILLLTEIACALILACVGAIYQSRSAARERQAYHPPGKLVDVGGYKLHLYCSGHRGPTVVLDYGLVGSYLDWFYVQPQVAQFARVCSYDRGGYGWSEPSPKPRLPGIIAAELHTLLKNAGEAPPYILAGHSFGAFNVLAFAKLYPQETAGVVLVDGSHPDESLPFRWQDKTWLRMMQWTMPLGLPRWRNWCGTGPSELQGLKKAISCQSKVQKAHYQQWEAFAQSAEEIRHLGTLGDIPLIVISRDPKHAGKFPDRDSVQAARNEERWQSLQRQLTHLSTNSTFVVADGSGHGVPIERPGVVIESIRRILEQMATKTAGS